jgi:outer membrane lipoprotein SlyB
MNTTTTSSPSTAAGIHRGVWIGGGLMALTIVALATTLVVKNNDAVADTAATPLVATTDGSTATTAVAAPVAANPAPLNDSTRPVVRHIPTPVRHDSARYNDAPQQVAAAPVCNSCGVIDGYSAVQVKGQNNGVGAVAGGLGGALVGSKIAGRGNHTLGGAIGAVGGGLLGNAIETHQRTVTEYDVRVRMADGSVRTVRQASIPSVGQRVNVEGNTLRAMGDQG